MIKAATNFSFIEPMKAMKVNWRLALRNKVRRLPGTRFQSWGRGPPDFPQPEELQRRLSSPDRFPQIAED
jgi:hypothetical protein